MVTMVDNHARVVIKYEPSSVVGTARVPFFEITRRDGKQYIYRSLGVLAGDTVNAASEDFHQLFERKFLLTRVENAQKVKSYVTYRYAFTSVEKGRGHRPASITFGPYRAVFQYTYHDDTEPPLAS